MNLTDDSALFLFTTHTINLYSSNKRRSIMSRLSSSQPSRSHFGFRYDSDGFFIPDPIYRSTIGQWVVSYAS